MKIRQLKSISNGMKSFWRIFHTTFITIQNTLTFCIRDFKEILDTCKVNGHFNLPIIKDSVGSQLGHFLCILIKLLHKDKRITIMQVDAFNVPFLSSNPNMKFLILIKIGKLRLSPMVNST